jgi:hypothetical protein
MCIQNQVAVNLQLSGATFVELDATAWVLAEYSKNDVGGTWEIATCVGSKGQY